MGDKLETVRENEEYSAVFLEYLLRDKLKYLSCVSGD